MIPNNSGELNRLHEFADTKLEQEYIRQYTVGSVGFVRIITFLIGVVYFSFLISDYLWLSEAGAFLTVLISRTVVCVASFMLYGFMSVSKRYEVFRRLYSGYIILLCASYLVNCFCYTEAYFYIHLLGIICIVLVTFLLPNRWGIKLAVSLAVCASYFIGSLAFHPRLDSRDFYSGMVYCVVILAMRSIGTYKSERERRLLYVNGKNLERLAKLDPMTGVYNRQTLNLELDAAIRGEAPFAIVLFDIDDFKLVNDRYGHLTGDQVLMEIVQTVVFALEESDSIFRFGGEEFVLLLRGKHPRRVASDVEEYRRLIDERLFEKGLHVTCSFGIAGCEEGDTAQSLLARADLNLYRAKESGKNCVVV